jgi:heme/copper-type cytochrome/quinol oxidase subunit 3
MRKFLAVIAMLAGAPCAVYSAFIIGFVYMMRSWSHVKDPVGDAQIYALGAFGLAVSGAAIYWGIRQLRRPKTGANSLLKDQGFLDEKASPQPD